MPSKEECWTFCKKLKDVELAHYASSLSFHTILSLIPILLISFSIFTKLPSFQLYYEKAQEFVLRSLIPTQQELFIQYLNQFMTNTLDMGVLGLIFVLYISIMFFLDYEKIVSKIFNVPMRRFWEAIVIYWAMITLMPLGLIVSFYTSSLLQDVLMQNELSLSKSLLQLSSYLVIWLIFLIMYSISAKIKIHFKSALLSSFVASLVWYISKNLFIFYVAYNKTYLSIYGSFSILLFFFLWIYFSWLIYLYGMKICALLNEYEATQSHEKCEDEKSPTPDTQQ